MNDPIALILLALLAPVASFLLLAAVPGLRRSGRPAAFVSIAAALTSLGAAIRNWQLSGGAVEPLRAVWDWLPAEKGPLATMGVLIDHQSTLMLILVTLVAALVQIYSLEYLHSEPKGSLGRYYAYQSLFVFSMMGVVIAPNLLQLFICWELVGVCSYLLIGFWYRKPEAARAALKAFWTTKAGDVGLLIGIVLLYRLTGTWDLVELRHLVEGGTVAAAGLGIITFCLYLGAMGKSAQFPLHVWLPDAMEGPTPVSALIHAATMVTAGVYLLVRTDFLFHQTPEVLALVAWIGGITALMAAILACVQTDIKRVLAYSTVSQLGYMMTAIGAGFASAGFLHLLTHGVFKALLFLGAGAVIHAVHSNEMKDMGGLFKRMPQVAIVFIIGTLSLAGVPLFAGFASKEEVLGATLAGGFMGPFLMLLTAAFLTAFYMFRVVFVVFFGPAKPAHAHAHADQHAHATGGDPGFSMGAPLWVLALSALAIGGTFTLHHPESEFTLPGWLTPAAVTVALAGILMAWLTYQRQTISADSLAAAFGPIRRAALAKFWIDDLFEGIYRGVLLGFARIIGWTDRYIVDGVLNVISAWTLDGGDALRRFQTGRVGDYIFALAAGLVVLMLWMGGGF
ncbi:MAG TPA: NADH-quinone oxidoreductase subunit L [Vicinamibacteria bacterium]|nr:NADH-quinone oxidoreductase subunit L [Vicinamibacteria bacterium]